jgi:hypothetical protein
VIQIIDNFVFGYPIIRFLTSLYQQSLSKWTYNDYRFVSLSYVFDLDWLYSTHQLEHRWVLEAHGLYLDNRIQPLIDTMPRRKFYSIRKILWSTFIPDALQAFIKISLKLICRENGWIHKGIHHRASGCQCQLSLSLRTRLKTNFEQWDLN